MDKKVFLVCNAHIDPVWQWEWEEGAAEAISTFRVAAEFCEEFDGFVFNHNEAILYQWIEEFEPALFERIRRLVKEGKWHIMGGWYLQPDCNMPSGEGFVRQIMEGRRYFFDKFGKAPAVAINFDPFGHTAGLVQIMAKCGYKGYLFCRPGADVRPLPAELFRWRGFGGAEIAARRVTSMYASSLGCAADKIKMIAQGTNENVDICLWGVGDHGGGPSRIDLERIEKLRAELAAGGIELVHATPEEYFQAASNEELPVFEGSLNPWAVGCYTSQIRVKQQYRRLENELLLTEKMCAAAEIAFGKEYPAEKIAQAQQDLLTVQFHDMLPGSSVEPAEKMALRMLDHGLELLSRARLGAFLALAQGQPRHEEGEIPIMVYNPHPFPVEGDFCCEMMLWDQNWDGKFSFPQVYQNGTLLSTQCEKEYSNINLDWRKRAVFHAVLAPMQMNRFACRYSKLDAKPVPQVQADDEYFYFENAFLKAAVSRRTGMLERYETGGKNYIQGASLDIYEDNADPWGMTVNGFSDRIASFELLSPQESGELSGAGHALEAVRVIEDGAVRTIVEAVLGYKRSRAVVQYVFSKTSDVIGCTVRLQWAEIQKTVKFTVKTTSDAQECSAQTAFGVQRQPITGDECVSGSYVTLCSQSGALGIANNGTYGFSAAEGEIRTTLLRSAAYCAHPIGDRMLIPDDRFTPHMEMGERIYEFRLLAGKRAEVERRMAETAAVLNEAPVSLSFFPSGTDGCKPAQSCVEIDGPLQMTAFKRAADENGYILRLFNPSAEASEAVVRCVLLKEAVTVSLKPYEFITFRLADGAVSEVNAAEEALS